MRALLSRRARGHTLILVRRTLAVYRAPCSVEVTSRAPDSPVGRSLPHASVFATGSRRTVVHKRGPAATLSTDEACASIAIGSIMIRRAGRSFPGTELKRSSLLREEAASTLAGGQHASSTIRQRLPVGLSACGSPRTKTIALPIGDQAGKHAGVGAKVNCWRFEPSARMTQIWLLPEAALAKTMCEPFGEGNGVTNDVRSSSTPRRNAGAPCAASC